MKTKGLNLGAMHENPKKKRRDRIQARCRRTRNKHMGSNLCAMPENPKRKEGIESKSNAKEPETK